MASPTKTPPHRRDLQPRIPEEALAAHFRTNPVYERALLVSEEHPDLPVHPTISSMLPIYFERRTAAGNVLSKDPGAVRQMVRESRAHIGVDEFTAPINRPPSDEATAALRKTIDGAAERYGEIGRPEEVDDDVYRATWAKAFRSGDSMAEKAAWDRWVVAWAVAANVAAERTELQAVLCIRIVSAPSVRLRPGDPLRRTGARWPDYQAEVARAMSVLPMGVDLSPVSTKPSKAGKS